jgi:uncharacterized protein with HEPN domain
MSRRDAERLQDILDAIGAIESHLTRGDLSDGLIFDAVRVRLIEIGEAIKAVSTQLLDTEPGHPWSDIARMRDRLAHRYFDTNHGHVSGAVHHDLEPLKAAVCGCRSAFPRSSSGPSQRPDKGRHSGFQNAVDRSLPPAPNPSCYPEA